MKEGIHPKYNPNVTITCACGGTFVAGSTDDEINVEICSSCHPFFTGKQKLVDTAGRVDKFRARVAAREQAEALKAKKPKKSEESKKAEEKSNKQ